MNCVETEIVKKNYFLFSVNDRVSGSLASSSLFLQGKVGRAARKSPA